MLIKLVIVIVDYSVLGLGVLKNANSRIKLWFFTAIWCSKSANVHELQEGNEG